VSGAVMAMRGVNGQVVVVDGGSAVAEERALPR
jgi:hypothetical protein